MPSLQWFTELTQRERRTLYAGFGGYAVDAFDFMIYSFLIPTLIATWGMTKSEAGMIATSSLISSAIGGWLAGILADRYGRVRVLQWTIATFAIFTCLSGFTHSFWQLLTTRTLQGIGFGGEWSVVTIMMAETIRSPQHRAKAVGTVQSSWSVRLGRGGHHLLGVLRAAAGTVRMARLLLDRPAARAVDLLHSPQCQRS